jgi:hypothetical protein
MADFFEQWEQWLHLLERRPGEPPEAVQEAVEEPVAAEPSSGDSNVREDGLAGG